MFDSGRGWRSRGGLTGVVVMLVLFAGCASTGSRGEEADLLRLAGSRELDPPRDGSERFVADTIPGPATRVFTAARFAFEEIGIPFSHYDAEGLQLGGYVDDLVALTEEPPSAWVDCGRSMSGATANEHEVSVAFGTRVVPIDATTSRLETVIRARSKARDVSSVLGRCRSLGTLERHIARTAKGLVR